MKRAFLGLICASVVGGCLPTQPPLQDPVLPAPKATVTAAKPAAAPPVTEAAIDERDPHAAAQALADELRRERSEK